MVKEKQKLLQKESLPLGRYAIVQRSYHLKVTPCVNEHMNAEPTQNLDLAYVITCYHKSPTKLNIKFEKYIGCPI